jgi:hypothetical protein
MSGTATLNFGQMMGFTETRDFDGDNFPDILSVQKTSINGSWTAQITYGQNPQIGAPSITRYGTYTPFVGGGLNNGIISIDLNKDGQNDSYNVNVQYTPGYNGVVPATIYGNIQWSNGGWGPGGNGQGLMTGTVLGWGGPLTLSQTRDINGDGVPDTLTASSSNSTFYGNNTSTATYRDGATGQTRYGSFRWTDSSQRNGQFYVDISGDGFADTYTITEFNRIPQGNGYTATYTGYLQQAGSSVWNPNQWPNTQWPNNQWPGTGLWPYTWQNYPYYNQQQWPSWLWGYPRYA